LIWFTWSILNERNARVFIFENRFFVSSWGSLHLSPPMCMGVLVAKPTWGWCPGGGGCLLSGGLVSSIWRSNARSFPARWCSRWNCRRDCVVGLWGDSENIGNPESLPIRGLPCFSQSKQKRRKILRNNTTVRKKSRQEIMKHPLWW